MKEVERGNSLSCSLLSKSNLAERPCSLSEKGTPQTMALETSSCSVSQNSGRINLISKESLENSPALLKRKLQEAKERVSQNLHGKQISLKGKFEQPRTLIGTKSLEFLSFLVEKPD